MLPNEFLSGYDSCLRKIVKKEFLRNILRLSGSETYFMIFVSGSRKIRKKIFWVPNLSWAFICTEKDVHLVKTCQDYKKNSLSLSPLSLTHSLSLSLSLSHSLSLSVCTGILRRQLRPRFGYQQAEDRILHYQWERS